MFTTTAVAVAFAFAVADRTTVLDPFGLPTATADYDTTLRVKAAFARDAELTTVPLLVSVADGVVVVGGPVPAADLLPRIERIATGVPGVSAVRTACWVEIGIDPLRRLVLDRAKPADPRPPATVVVQKAMPTVTSFLLDPAAPVPTPYPTIPPPAVPVEPDAAAEVAAVRRADRRFAGLTTTVRSGVVTITGVADDGDAWDLAAAVRVLPGVRRVVVGRIDVR